MTGRHTFVRMDRGDNEWVVPPFSSPPDEGEGIGRDPVEQRDVTSVRPVENTDKKKWRPGSAYSSDPR